MASGLEQDPRGFDAAVVMARWMFPYIGFMSLVALGAGILNTWRRFAVPAFTPVLLNLAMIVAIWLGAPWFARIGIEPIYAMVMGVIGGGVLQLGIPMAFENLIPCSWACRPRPCGAWACCPACAGVGPPCARPGPTPAPGASPP